MAGANYRVRRADQRRALVTKLAREGISDRRVLDAIDAVPRELFVPRELVEEAYLDTALPIGEGQTISQPFVVAYMTELLDVQPHHRVLEVGTGSGYQTAILAELAREVFSIEIIDSLAEQAKRRLAQLGYTNVHVRTGDASAGWPEQAPFDRIMVTAAAPRIPEQLLEQLAAPGRMVVPVDEWGGLHQSLVLVRKAPDGKTRTERSLPVAFVPMRGAVRGE
ncbi:MAG: protein-L-isoaspartate(D-aspartate) O-methyltransferase [Candidatus Dadabacteria bacterium]|nr:MAG: protein-L-isoaspartate(D-aspartate) O-methyltransferase [Candidatus Dadabacteria bacterium]